jgi:hypothetical protein
VSVRLVDKAGSMIATRTSRRGFLTRSAVVGSAVAAAPAAYVLRPGTAYAAICSCNNQSCDCGQTCCDGYTEFCCTMTGENTCPTGTIPAGWWKVDGSSYCVTNGSPGPRYYLDCNAAPSGPCGPSGVTKSTDLCDCSCADGNCNNRKACCTAFRYGQCNQQVACLGPIVCRVVTCTPPWNFDPTCTTATATDNNTRWHHRPCLERPTPERGALPATFNNGVWTLGFAMEKQSRTETVRFSFGQPGDIPVMGDWNGDGTHTVGVVRGNQWILRNTNDAGPADYNFTFGDPGDIPVVGDWNGDGTTGIGVRMADRNKWRLRNTASAGRPDHSFRFGRASDTPIAGDWNGDGKAGVASIRHGFGDNNRSKWFIRNTLSAGRHDRAFFFGTSDMDFVVGDWGSSGIDYPGFVRPGGKWKLRSAGPSGVKFGGGDEIPVAWQAASWTPGRLPS